VTRQTSLYLDAVRFVAAMVVFIGHIAGKRFTEGFLWQFSLYMDDSVTIFFVLSGFVIAYVVDTRERDATAYAVARAARLYSVVLPAILLAIVLDHAGMAIRPDLYTAAWGFSADRYWEGIVQGVFFLNRIWYQTIDVGSIMPFWSLCYEAWYYVIFGVMLFAPPRWRLPLVCGILLLVGPRIAAMMPLWLLGVATYWISARGLVGERAGWVLCLGALAGFVAYEAWTHANGAPDVAPAFLNLPSLTNTYVVAVLFALHLLGFAAVSHHFARPLEACAGPIRWAAGATFSIYLLHVPIAQFLTTLVPWPPSAWPTRVVMLGGTLC
jgi:peptidoglycan/LPS O-acetylase OafA/YrhL